MNYSSIKIKASELITLLVVLAGLTISCEKKISPVPNYDILTLPSLTARDFETSFNDSGRLQVVLSAPLMEKYNTKEKPYSEFTSGVKVVFYDGKPVPEGSVTARYAKYTDSNNLWELKDSVVVINQNNGKLETELLYWDQQKDLIYTDRFVRITNDDQITLATGFESDSKLKVQKLKKVSAIIPLKDEK
jgi:LPS export ABC transporter protein LptC